MAVTITLRKIRAHNPCNPGWEKILAATHLHGGDFDREFPLLGALDNNGLRDAIWAMRCLPEHDRLWRLFAVRCARKVQHLMTDPRSIAALDVAERHANGEATDEELSAALAAAWAALAAARDAAWAARDAAWAARDAAWAARDAAWAAARDAAWAAAWAAARDEQEQILRELLEDR